MAEKKTIPTNPLGNLAELTREVISNDDPTNTVNTEVSTNEEPDGWARFTDYARQYYNAKTKSRGATVWIDEDVKAALDTIKSTGACNIPVRHLVSAAVRTFIEEHKKEITKAIKKNKSSLL